MHWPNLSDLQVDILDALARFGPDITGEHITRKVVRMHVRRLVRRRVSKYLRWIFVGFSAFRVSSTVYVHLSRLMDNGYAASCDAPEDPALQRLMPERPGFRRPLYRITLAGQIRLKYELARRAHKDTDDRNLRMATD